MKRKHLLNIAALLLISNFAFADNVITHDQLVDKARGMWLAQMIANTTGRPTEGDYYATPYPGDEDIPFVIKGDPEGWPADDDTDIEYINLHILETYGFDCTPQQMSDEWRNHITTSGIYISNRQAWFLMGDGVLPPETGSRNYNMHWYSIDSQITNETTGTICPGMKSTAANLTRKFAEISNDGYAIDAACFYSVMYANAFFDSDIRSLIDNAIGCMSPMSRSYEVINDVRNWYDQDMLDGEPDWRATRQLLYDYYCGSYSYGRYHNWIESTVNLGATVLALLYGNGDFKQTVQIGIKAGWDSDCNPATAAGIIGVINGFSGLPSDLVDPSICSDKYVNVYRPYLPDHNAYRPQNDTISNIANRIANLTAQNILANGGSVISESPLTYSIPEQLMPATPSCPHEPIGLVAAALDEGVDVSVTAAVANYNTNYDRYNLNAIIDGVYDNSWLGVRPYYSYSSQTKEQDWYQINFAQTVKFSRVVFYEGDIVWSGINTYCRDDDLRGGYFEDLTVEVLRDGRYYTPSNLVMSEPLDKYKMYQKIVFDFDECIGEAIRLVGKPGGSQTYTTILEMEVNGQLDPGFYLDHVVFNSGDPQRSHVDEIKLEFNRNIYENDLDIDIVPLVDGDPLPELSIVQGDSLQEYYISFVYDPAIFDYPALHDGLYELQVNGNALSNYGGNEDCDVSVKFHRLFGDVDGNGQLDVSDLDCFAQDWLLEDFNGNFDLNSDNYIDYEDYSGLVKRWNVQY